MIGPTRLTRQLGVENGRRMIARHRQKSSGTGSLRRSPLSSRNILGSVSAVSRKPQSAARAPRRSRFDDAPLCRHSAHSVLLVLRRPDGANARSAKSMPALIERLNESPADCLDALIAESEQYGLRFIRRLADEWRSGANRLRKSQELRPTIRSS